MQLDRFGVQVLIGGRPAHEYSHDGRTFIPGRPGKDYTLRLVNRSPRRAKAVLTVDGLNVISGKPATLDGGGYILDAYTTADIPGWRVTDDEVARFVFGAPETSYAAAKGKAENVGIIGAAFYDEVPPKINILREALTSAPVPTSAPRGPKLAKGGAVGLASLSAASPGTYGGSLGTGFGAKTDHAIKRVEFEARPHPAAVIEIRYEDAAILRGLGLDVADDADLVHSPSAFPASEGYCSPPSGWRG